jgi:hypothetical protein
MTGHKERQGTRKNKIGILRICGRVSAKSTAVNWKIRVKFSIKNAATYQQKSENLNFF